MRGERQGHRAFLWPDFAEGVANIRMVGERYSEERMVRLPERQEPASDKIPRRQRLCLKPGRCER